MNGQVDEQMHRFIKTNKEISTWIKKRQWIDE